MEPTLGGEDFSFFAQDVPGAFVFLGQGSSRLEVNGFGIPPKTDFLTNTSLHSSRFTMDDTGKSNRTVVLIILVQRRLCILLPMTVVALVV